MSSADRTRLPGGTPANVAPRAPALAVLLLDREQREAIRAEVVMIADGWRDLELSASNGDRACAYRTLRSVHGASAMLDAIGWTEKAPRTRRFAGRKRERSSHEAGAVGAAHASAYVPGDMSPEELIVHTLRLLLDAARWRWPRKPRE